MVSILNPIRRDQKASEPLARLAPANVNEEVYSTTQIPNITNQEKVMRSNTLLKIAIMLAIVVAASTSTRADVSACSNMAGIAMERVTYQHFFTSSTDPRAEAGDSQHEVKLRGWLYYDATNFVENAPVLIYNHGHNQDRIEPCAIAKYFVNLGYVVFAPLRRGHSGVTGSQIKSTGIHTDTYVNKCMRSQESAIAQGGGFQHLFCGSVFCRQDVACSHPQRANAIELFYIRNQVEDVDAQIEYIKSRAAINRTDGKLADPKRIAILGHSYGGSLIIFANENRLGQSVAIDISGAELSWEQADTPFWELDLKDAMQNQ
ncbi:MAG TPA: hypothetical protein VIB00_01850, partial [Pyrinomonadaceae bacterium]